MWFKIQVILSKRVYIYLKTVHDTCLIESLMLNGIDSAIDSERQSKKLGV
jgi:hypothetical protein